MAHKAEICSVYFKHIIELLGLRFGPLAALDGGLGYGFVDMPVRFSMRILFIFRNKTENIPDSESLLKSVMKLFTVI